MEIEKTYVLEIGKTYLLEINTHTHTHTRTYVSGLAGRHDYVGEISQLSVLVEHENLKESSPV